jgi:branched-chain amino acid transport system permease protein
VLQAIRDNEERAEFIGYDVRIFKRRSFVISGIIGGLSGSLFALLRFVDPDVLHWFTSAEALVMNLFGGMGTLYGPVIGAIVFLFSKDLISSYTEHWRLILGVIFVGFVLYSPRGIVGLYDTFRGKVVLVLFPSIWRRVGRETEGTRESSMSEMSPAHDRESSPKSKGDLSGPGAGTKGEGEG